MGQVVLQPTEGDAKDTYIDKDNPTSSNATSASLYFGQDNDPKASDHTYRTLIGWDMSAIPAGSIILSTSKLELYVVGGFGAAWEWTIHRITEALWTESCTWNQYDFNSNPALNQWATAGGDFGSPTAEFTFPSGTDVYKSFSSVDLAEFLQDALDNRGKLAEMLLKTDDESTRNFRQLDSSNGTNVPILTIDFIPPGVKSYVYIS